MKKYNIGEALLNFKVDSLVYFTGSNIKGALAWVDINNENRIVVAYPDGGISHGLHVAIRPDTPKEDSECIVFINELRESLKNDMDEAQSKEIYNLLDDVDEAINRVAKHSKK